MNFFHVDLLKDNILKALIIFSIPILISNIFQQFYNTMDIAIVGNILGDTSLAAIGACTAIYDLLIGFALGVGNGLSIVISRSYGAKNYDEVKKGVVGSVVLGMLLTFIVMIFGFVGLKPLLELLNTPKAIIDESLSYIFPIVMGVGVMFAYNLLAGLLRAIGNSFMPLVFLVLSSIVNIALDIILINEFHMGVQGAAYATIIAQGISFILCLFYIFKYAKVLIPNKKHFHVEKSLYKELAGQGFSMGLMMAIVSSGTLILQYAINGFGKNIIAAHTTARKINAFCTMPCATISSAVATFVSQNKGSNQKDRIKIGVSLGNKINVVWGIIATLLLIVGAKSLVEIVSGSQNELIIHNATWYLWINGPFYAILGILLNLRTALQGLGEKLIPLVSSVIEFVAKIIFAIFLIPSLGYMGVILCEPIIWCLMTLQLIYAYKSNVYLNE